MSLSFIPVLLIASTIALYIVLIKNLKNRQDKKLQQLRDKRKSHVADEFGYADLKGHDEGIMGEVHLN